MAILLPDDPRKSENRRRFPCHGHDYPCYICGRPAPNPRFYLHVVGGGDTAIQDGEL